MPSPSRTTTRRYRAVDERRARALAGLSDTVFTTTQALAAGLTRGDLASDAVTQVRRGAYVAGRPRITHEIRCAAALAVAPADSRIIGVSAAQLWGLPVPQDDRLRVGVTSRVRVELQGCLIRQVNSRGVPWRATARSAPICVTAMTDLLAECVGELPLLDAVVLADAVLQRVPPEQRADVLAGWRASASRVLALAASLARAGAESPQETRTRLLLVTGGLPEPVLQHDVQLGARRYRLDLAYPDVRVAVEYDGQYHFADEHQKQRDVLRWEALERAGWIVIRVVPQGIYRDPAGTLVRVRDALRSRGVLCDIAPGWEAHFAQRRAGV